MGLGAWVLDSGWRHVRDDRRLQESSAEVEGRVVGSSTRELGKGGQSMTLVVKYAPEAHAPITKEFDVDSSDYKSALASGKAIVTYLPGDPRISRVTHFAILPFQFLIGLGGLMMAAGVFCIGHAVMSRKKA